MTSDATPGAMSRISVFPSTVNVLIVLCVCCVGNEAQAIRVHDDLLFWYTFDDFQFRGGMQAQDNANGLLGNIIINEQAGKWADLSNGITSSGDTNSRGAVAMSSHDVSLFSGAVSPDWSIDIWARLKQPASPTDAVLLEWKPEHTQSGDGCPPECEGAVCPGSNYPRSFLLKYLAPTESGESHTGQLQWFLKSGDQCHTGIWNLPAITGNLQERIVHVVATFRQSRGALFLFVDGVRVFRQTDWTAHLPVSSGWAASGAKLHLLETRWTGVLLSVAMYNRELTSEEVLQNYAAWLPNNPPVARDSIVWINENSGGKVVPGVFDLDREMETQVAQEIEVMGNAKPRPQIHDSVQIQFTSLPFRGMLVANDDILSISNIDSPYDSDTLDLSFRPWFGDAGTPYTTFVFLAANDLGLYTTSATVTIMVPSLEETKSMSASSSASSSRSTSLSPPPSSTRSASGSRSYVHVPSRHPGASPSSSQTIAPSHTRTRTHSSSGSGSPTVSTRPRVCSLPDLEVQMFVLQPVSVIVYPDQPLPPACDQRNPNTTNLRIWIDTFPGTSAVNIYQINADGSQGALVPHGDHDTQIQRSPGVGFMVLVASTASPTDPPSMDRLRVAVSFETAAGGLAVVYTIVKMFMQSYLQPISNPPPWIWALDDSSDQEFALIMTRRVSAINHLEDGDVSVVITGLPAQGALFRVGNSAPLAVGARLGTTKHIDQAGVFVQFKARQLDFEVGTELSFQYCIEDPNEPRTRVLDSLDVHQDGSPVRPISQAILTENPDQRALGVHEFRAFPRKRRGLDDDVFSGIRDRCPSLLRYHATGIITVGGENHLVKTSIRCSSVLVTLNPAFLRVSNSSASSPESGSESASPAPPPPQERGPDPEFSLDSACPLLPLQFEHPGAQFLTGDGAFDRVMTFTSTRAVLRVLLGDIHLFAKPTKPWVDDVCYVTVSDGDLDELTESIRLTKASFDGKPQAIGAYSFKQSQDVDMAIAVICLLSLTAVLFTINVAAWIYNEYIHHKHGLSRAHEVPDL